MPYESRVKVNTFFKLRILTRNQRFFVKKIKKKKILTKMS